MKTRNKLITKTFLILTLILAIFSTQIINAKAEDATSAMHRAAAKYGWTWTNLGHASISTYYVYSNEFFARWYTQPTCTSNGIAVLSNGAREITYNVGALDHQWDYYSSVAATCTTPGTTTYRCPYCGATTTSQTQAALGHSYNAYTVDVQPTCTTAGSKSQHCQRSGCTATQNTTSVPANGHNYGTPSYKWEDVSSCTASKTCQTCNESAIEIIKTKLVDNPATCTESGTITYVADFADPAFETQTNVVTTPATGHTLDFRNCINCDYVAPLITGSIKTDSEEDTDLNIKICEDTKKEEIRNVLNKNMTLDSKKEIIEIIEINNENIAENTEITLDLKYVANEGDEVTLLDMDNNNECENIGTFTVRNDQTISCEVEPTTSTIIIIPGTLGEVSATNNTTVYAEVGSEFKVTIPKHIIIDGTTKTGTYTVSVNGDIAGTELINITPDVSVTLKSTNLNDVVAPITQDEIQWKYNEILEESAKVANGTIDASGISAGSWNGNFNFNIKLEGEKEYKDSISDVEYNDVIYNY